MVKLNSKVQSKKSKIFSLHPNNRAQGMKLKISPTSLSNKAQMKVQQTAFMLIALTILFVMVAMVVLMVKVGNLRSEATSLEEQNAILLSTKLANSPEFSCGDAFGTSKVNCVDANKIMALKEHIEDYENFWSVENIEVRKIYPSTGDELCTKSNYPDCAIIRLYDQEISGFDSSSFVALCRKELTDEGIIDRCELAKLIISYEKK